jgi:hypothetical protein
MRKSQPLPTGDASPRQIFEITTYDGGEFPAAQPRRDRIPLVTRHADTNHTRSSKTQRERWGRERKRQRLSQCTTCRVWAGSCQPCFRAMAPRLPPRRGRPPLPLLAPGVRPPAPHELLLPFLPAGRRQGRPGFPFQRRRVGTR